MIVEEIVHPPEIAGETEVDDTGAEAEVDQEIDLQEEEDHQVNQEVDLVVDRGLLESDLKIPIKRFSAHHVIINLPSLQTKENGRDRSETPDKEANHKDLPDSPRYKRSQYLSNFTELLRPEEHKKSKKSKKEKKEKKEKKHRRDRSRSKSVERKRKSRTKSKSKSVDKPVHEKSEERSKPNENEQSSTDASPVRNKRKRSSEDDAEDDNFINKVR